MRTLLRRSLAGLVVGLVACSGSDDAASSASTSATSATSTSATATDTVATGSTVSATASETGTVSTTETATTSPGDCACNADVDGDGDVVFFSADTTLIRDCEGQPLATTCDGCASGTCADADVDCNGRIDQCDIHKVACAELGATDCCEVPCGACCLSADSNLCEGAGLTPPCCRLFDEPDCGSAEFLGDNVPCPPDPRMCGGA